MHGDPSKVTEIQIARHPRSVSSSYQPSIRNLPPELILTVFRWLSQTIYPLAFTYTPRFPAFFFNGNVVSEPDIGQVTLANVGLVCRAWCSLGQKVLYARPFLVSHQRLRLFARTLADAPQLATYVQQLFVLNQESSTSPNWAISLLPPTQVDSEPSLRQDIISCLQSCSLVTTIVFSMRYQMFHSILPFDQALIDASFISSRLRKLTIYGATFPTFAGDPHFLSPDILLPNLEVLCLRELSSLSQHDLPVFPRLHTLQIVECFKGSGDRSEPWVTAATVPSLRTLELYGNYSPFLLDERCLHGLQTLHFVGPLKANQSGFSHWGNPKFMTQLSHLTFGQDFIPEPSFLSYLPPTVETLTFLIDNHAYSQVVHPPSLPPCDLSGAYKCIVSNFGRKTRLRKMAIIWEPVPDGNTAEIDARMDKLRALCEAQKVVLEVRSGSTSYPPS